MMEHNLFTLGANARRNDPISSYKAADGMNSSGRVRTDRLMVLAALVGRDGWTAKQLDRQAGLHGKARRRMLELEKLGYVRRLKPRNGAEMTCFITDAGREALE